MDITTVLSSGVMAGLVAGLVTLRTSERKIAIENITKQREVWRDKVRNKSLDVTNAIENKSRSKLCGLYTEFSHLLNPEDTEDLAILNLLWSFKSGKTEEELHLEFIERVSLLLKHDWERAKREAKPWFFFTKEPERANYNDYENKRETANEPSRYSHLEAEERQRSEECLNRLRSRRIIFQYRMIVSSFRRGKKLRRSISSIT